MEITKRQIELITLTPREGYYLTQANLKDNEEVILSLSVTLGKLDTLDNWREIEIAEGEALKAQRDKELQSQIEL